MRPTNYLKVTSHSLPRTTRHDVFPFTDSRESLERALAAANAMANSVAGRVVVWQWQSGLPASVGIVGEAEHPAGVGPRRPEWADA
jgi:hypothetical protein